MVYHYKPKGVCARSMAVELEGGVISSVRFEGGCGGNLSGISKLVEGMRADEVIAKFKGTHCGNRATSCPDQLAKALAEALAQNEK